MLLAATGVLLQGMHLSPPAPALTGRAVGTYASVLLLPLLFLL
jgi:hypothetical protein